MSETNGNKSDIEQWREKYRTPPKKVFRSLGLGIEHHGIVRVIAGFRQAKWWDSFPSPEPLFVNARIIRRKAVLSK